MGRFGDPAGIQTQDLQNRNLTLYSAKLRGLRVWHDSGVAANLRIQCLIATTAKKDGYIINQSTQ